MQKTISHLHKIKLIGIKCRTNNQAEQNAATAKIAPTVQRYFQTSIGEKIPNRLDPGTTYCVYTEYESDHTGQYTCFVGEVVSACSDTPEGLFELIIPKQTYVKFTNGPGVMPDICVKAWQEIWKMNQSELGGARAYLADFEIYDSRAVDPAKLVFDIYVGIKN